MSNVKYSCDKCGATVFAPPGLTVASSKLPCKDNLGGACGLVQVEEFGSQVLPDEELPPKKVTPVVKKVAASTSDK